MHSLLFALFAATVVSAAGTNKCANDIEELVSRTSCGSSRIITSCLRANIDIAQWDEISKCFESPSEAEGSVEAILLAKGRNEGSLADNKGDLKKRADDPDSTEASTTGKQTAKTSAKTSAKTTSAPAKTTSESSTEATTTTESSSASAAASSTTSTPSSTTTESTSTSSTQSTTQTTSTASTSGALVCSVTSMKSTSACSIHAGTTVTCTPTMTAIASCAPGLICFSPTAGADSCIVKHNELTTSGLAVTITFGVCITAALLAWFIMAMRTRSQNKHRAEVVAMMASGGGKTRDVETANPFGARRLRGSEANLPLITPGGTRSDRGAYGEIGEQDPYFDASGRNPAPAPPKLHQGLGALK